MAKYTYEYLTRVSWVPIIVSKAAPTVAELNAGTDLSTLVTKDGLSTPTSQNMVDNTTLAERFDAQVVGSFGGSGSLKLKRDNVADDAWDLFDWAETGYLVVRRGDPFDQAWAAADVVEVYPAQSHMPVMDNTAANTQQTFTVGLAFTEEPELRGVVAA